MNFDREIDEILEMVLFFFTQNLHGEKHVEWGHGQKLIIIISSYLREMTTHAHAQGIVPL